MRKSEGRVKSEGRAVKGCRTEDERRSSLIFFSASIAPEETEMVRLGEGTEIIIAPKDRKRPQKKEEISENIQESVVSKKVRRRVKECKSEVVEAK